MMKISLVVLGAAVGTVVGGAAFGYGLRGYVVGYGGRSAPPATSGAYRAYGTVGVPGGASQGGGSGACSGFWCVGGPRVLATDPGARGPLPVEFALGAATPSPTRGESRFDLALPRAAVVTLVVYDVAGRQVGDVLSRAFEPGEHRLFWRAGDLGAGVYFVRLFTDGVLRAKRTVVLVR